MVYRAAYTAVDAAEDEGKELDHAINVTGTENVAKASEKHRCNLVYISTDWLFYDGNQWDKNGSRRSTRSLKQEYGRTKRYGEELVEKHVSNFYIIRTALVWNYGKNFVPHQAKLS